MIGKAGETVPMFPELGCGNKIDLVSLVHPRVKGARREILDKV